MKISTLIVIILTTLISLGSVFGYYIYFIIPKGEISTKVNNPRERERRIVAFGDSLTIGYNLPIADSYPSQLQNKIIAEGYNYKVINLGISGDTTTGGLARLQDVLSYSPDIVLLELGANDFLSSQSPETAEKNLDTIIKVFDDKNIKVILLNASLSTLLPLPNGERFLQIMPNLSKKYGLSIVPSFLEGVLLDPKYTLEDKLHPNKAGYTKALDQNLWPVLEKELLR